MRRVLVLSSYYQPEQVSNSHLTDDLFSAIIRENIGLVVFTPMPSRGIDEETRREYKKKKKEVLWDGQMIVYRFPLLAEGKGTIKRALRYILACIKHFNRGIFAHDAHLCDVLFVASTPPIQGAMAALVKKFSKKHFIYNLQDIFPDSLAGSGIAKKDSVFWKIGRVIENFTYRNADKIIVISQDFKRNIMAKGVPEKKIEVIYNWVDENAIVPIRDDENELFEEFGIRHDTFRVVYAGNLGNAQNIEIILDAARRLKGNAHIQFIIFGKGGLEEEIKAAKEKEKLDNLMIQPLQPYERVAKVYGLGHLCIVACKPGLGGAAMPSKTWSIMSSGRAVLASFDEGELKEILEGGGNENANANTNRVSGVNGNGKACGVFTRAGDLDAFVTSIVELSEHPERCVEMGRNGREFILNNLTKEVGTRRYVEAIKQLEK